MYVCRKALQFEKSWRIRSYLHPESIFGLSTIGVTDYRRVDHDQPTTGGDVATTGPRVGKKQVRRADDSFSVGRDVYCVVIIHVLLV